MLYGLCYPIFVGSFASYEVKNLPFYSFSQSKIISKITKDMTKEAENTVREEMGIPKIGEGRVAETELFYKIKKAFPNLAVIQHARPKWLGKQHFDIFIPSKKIAIEYQGTQHYKPVEFFGGKKAFELNKKRDKLKKEKCLKYGVKLIEVRSEYDFDVIIKEVRRSL
jgi:hypothetical protein